MISPRSLRLCLALLLAVVFSACSSFDTRWKAAANGSGAQRWDGRWSSAKHVTGSGAPEGGRLRAVTEIGPDKGLTAHFHANWLVFSSNYSATLALKGSGPGRDGVREYTGTHALPKMFGGLYHYEARLAGDQLTARYSSSYDHGTFTLHRVAGAKVYAPEHARH